MAAEARHQHTAEKNWNMPTKPDTPLVDARTASPPFQLRVVTFNGQGLDEKLRDADWGTIRDLAYERGGER
jgi:hypothetical protein